ncbi:MULTISPECIES: glycine zipper 2TM domain-containing protein [Silvimonas]|uniref:glycine zipper 2TM domain-containing protein n=1 Tax=Silvimonas TaxID=300264 RepID=UPI0024B351BA|nr:MULTISPECIES: glycine zipper 2TM domain-containing protein [Silvimonas]MDR3426796.1 glycine zipper 2TM domain-containing protein [Silvimonas sp.]
MKNHIKTQIAVLLALVTGCAMAEAYPDYARVVNSTAIVQRVNTPHQECWTENQQVQTQNQSGGVLGTIIGGVAGGVLGHQVGGGRGKDAATVAGTIGGALIGNSVGSGQPQVQNQQVQRCRQVDGWQDQVTGYRVTYDYKGRQFTANMPQQPGDRIPVEVNVTPR